MNKSTLCYNDINNPALLSNIISTPETLHKWLLESKLIKDHRNMLCSKCNTPFNLVKKSDKLDGYIWRCRSKCTSTSYRDGAFLSIFPKIPLPMLIDILFLCFLSSISAIETAEKFKNKHVTISEKTVYHIYHTLRLAISKWMNKQNQSLISNKQVVEADESLFSHADGLQRWVVGLIERESQKARCFVVDNRSKATMKQLFTDNVEKGAEIRTDGALAYKVLADRYDIHQVNKARDGLPKGDETTAHIEGLWGELKQIRRKVYHGITPVKTVELHISELLFRRECYLFKNEKTKEQRLIDILIDFEEDMQQTVHYDAIYKK